jgi:hypothetical protein
LVEYLLEVREPDHVVSKASFFMSSKEKHGCAAGETDHIAIFKNLGILGR